MQTATNTAFAAQSITGYQTASATIYGAWQDISQFTHWSLHIMNLEADGKIQIFLSNEPIQPGANYPAGANPANPDPVAVQFGSDVTTTSDNANTMVQSGGAVAHWLQIVKVNGETPATTVVSIFGQIEH